MKFVENDKKIPKLSQSIIEFFGKTGTINFFSSFICILGTFEFTKLINIFLSG